MRVVQVVHVAHAGLLRIFSLGRILLWLVGVVAFVLILVRAVNLCRELLVLFFDHAALDKRDVLLARTSEQCFCTLQLFFGLLDLLEVAVGFGLELGARRPGQRWHVRVRLLGVMRPLGLLTVYTLARRCLMLVLAHRR